MRPRRRNLSQPQNAAYRHLLGVGESSSRRHTTAYARHQAKFDLDPFDRKPRCRCPCGYTCWADTEAKVREVHKNHVRRLEGLR